MIVIIKTGEHNNLTRSTVQFDKYGAPTRQDYIFCNSWNEGLAQATEYDKFLFLQSGAYFSDWFEFTKVLSNYPHKGIIAHIMRGKGFHGQCLYIERQCLSCVDLENKSFVGTVIESNKNIHDDYTPLYATVDKQVVVNFNSTIRTHKGFLYPNSTVPDFKEYKSVAENQLWVYNNEPIELINAKRILMPGSGLYWLLQAAYTDSDIQILDISTTQVNFCNHLLNNWDGTDYNGVVKKFINENKVQHYIDEYPVDLPDDFAEKWQTRTSKVSARQGDIVEHILSGNTQYDFIWTSNITNYKWGLITHSEEALNKFNETVKQTQ